MIKWRTWANENPFVARMRWFYSSVWYPVWMACLTLFSYTLQLEYVAWLLVLLTVIPAFLFCEDMMPILIASLFAPFFIAYQNSPGTVHHGGDLFAPHNLIWIALLAAAVVVLFVAHLVLWGGAEKPFTQKTELTWFLIPLAITLLTNGLGHEAYTVKNLLYACLTCLTWIGFYLVYYFRLPKGQDAVHTFCRACFWVAVALIGEIIWVYTTNGVLADGGADSKKIYFGWGIYNNYGGIMALLIPVIFYLAATRRRGWIYYLGGLATWFAVALSNSRSSLLVGSLILVVCVVSVAFVGSHKKLYRIFLSVLAVGMIAAIFLFGEEISELLPRYAQVGFNDNGRIKIWKDTIALFKESPIFGAGFYEIPFDSYAKILPGIAHNTPVELLGAGGILLFLSYAAYRAKTVWLILRRPTVTRWFLGLCLATVIGTSLLDNHLFNIYPMFFYCGALVLIEHDYTATALSPAVTPEEPKD